ncbi:MAG: ribosome recycling factor [Tepidamorphaceae bacterium]|nr:ribosome recycling factor [Rhodobiaceae bacterium]
MSQSSDMADLKRRMDGAVSVLRSELGGLRTGRASASLLDPIQVDAYGAVMPLNQVGTVAVPEPRMISVQVWDRGLVGAVDKAIRESSLNLNPVVEGQLLRIPIPELNAERRQELVKVAHKYAEAARVAVRHVRRDGLDSLKKAEKDKTIGEDEARSRSDEVQKLTDAAIAEIDEVLATKEKEILQV